VNKLEIQAWRFDTKIQCAKIEYKNQPLTPYEGERENRSLVFEQANGLDFREVRVYSLIWPKSFAGILSLVVLLIGCFAAEISRGASANSLFQRGLEAYGAGDYPTASRVFGESALLKPASGTLLNLGISEWSMDHPGTAVLSWEQAAWVDPFNQNARNNLRFARKVAQLESPDLTWYEVVSTWLPANWWAWIAGMSFWGAVAMVMLPNILRWRRAVWHQALAALGLAVFLLSVPAHVGVYTRSRLGFIMDKNTPLRLTPTQDAQFVTRLAAGEPARLVRTRGNYLLVKTSRTTGWLEARDIGFVSRRLL